MLPCGLPVTSAMTDIECSFNPCGCVQTLYRINLRPTVSCYNAHYHRWEHILECAAISLEALIPANESRSMKAIVSSLLLNLNITPTLLSSASKAMEILRNETPSKTGTQAKQQTRDIPELDVSVARIGISFFDKELAELAHATVTEMKVSCVDRDFHQDLQFSINLLVADSCLPRARYRRFIHHLESKKAWKQRQHDLLGLFKLAKGESFGGR